jgi:arsenate reductase
MIAPPLRLLFLCTHNRCRSILFEALVHAEGGPKLEARSAGSDPAGAVHPATLAALSQEGMGTEGLKSEGWEAHRAWAPELVITVCDRAAGESCPLWLGASPRLHWSFADPSALPEGPEQRQAFHQTLEAMRKKLGLLHELAAQPRATLPEAVKRLSDA